MLNNDLLIQYFINKATILSLDFDEQNKKSSELDMGDYFTEDIANDWFDEDIKILNELVNKKLISSKTIELYSMINNNFVDLSLNSKLYEENIWTLNALKEHIFWKNQRNLAKQFINELLKK